MGVRGLTTFIYNNSNKYFDSFKLHDSNIVIDGNCLASILFYNTISNTASFGGDYDRYAKGIEDFFNELLKSNVKPYVIFDGGYERKKIHTVYNRNREKVLCLQNIGPTSHSKICFPLMMRQVFRDKLKEMNIPYAQSDLEADREIAALARKLQCPVLSNDSDFFIFDVLLIPLNQFSLKADVDIDGSYYISCLIYRVEKFLASLGGLPKSHLPLLAALLGNDYISTSTFANFYSQMKITRGRKLCQIHFRVEAVISWLKRETYESALKKILWHLKKRNQKVIAMKVAKIIQGYCQVSTPLDAYLVKNKQYYDDIEIISIEDILHQYDNVDEPIEYCVEQNISSGSDTVYENEDDNYSLSDHKNEESESDKVEIATSKFKSKELPNGCRTTPLWLIDYSRSGNVPSCIITFFSLKTFFCVPQVEDYDMNHAGEIGLPILSKIAGILLGDETFSYYSRTNKNKYMCSKLETITCHGKNKFPSVATLNQLNPSQKKTLFLDIFECKSNDVEVVNNFPQEWHLFIYSLLYWSKNIIDIAFNSYYLHAVTIMIVCIRIIESKIGYFRNKRPFMQRYASMMKKFNSNREIILKDSKKIEEWIEKLPLEECIHAFEIFLPYFQIDEKLKTNSKFFSRKTIHAFSQFQVCIDLAYTLNSLLMSPFHSLPVYYFFNSTFLYNFCTNFRKRSSIMSYVETLFSKCPMLLRIYKIIIEDLNSLIITNEKPEGKKRKKKKKNFEKSDDFFPEVERDIDSSYSDENNTFSILSKFDP